MHGSIKKQKYMKFLQLFLLAFAYTQHGLKKQNFIFVQNSKALSIARYCKKWLKTMKMAKLLSFVAKLIRIKKFSQNLGLMYFMF